jgi:hypothetical protein
VFSPKAVVIGFNLSYGDYYILLRPIIKMVLMTGLHNEKDMASENADFIIRPIVDDLKNHALLQKKGKDAVTPWWADKILSRWVAAVARWVAEHITGSRTRNIPANPLAFKMGVSPFPRDCIRTAIEYHPDISRDKGRFPMLEKLQINIDLLYDNEMEKTADQQINATDIMTTPTDSTNVLTEGSPLRDFTRLSFSSLVSAVEEEWEDLSEEQWVLAYMNPFWGNETLAIRNDLELWVAAYELRVRGSEEITLLVSFLTRPT